MKTWYNNDAAWHYVQFEAADAARLSPTTLWVLRRIKMAKMLCELIEKDLQSEVDCESREVGHDDVDSRVYDLGLVNKARLMAKNALEILGASFVWASPRVYRGKASISIDIRLINISVMLANELNASEVTGLKSFRIRPFPEDMGELTDEALTPEEAHELKWAYDCRKCYR